jgi:hypothetical protein
MSGLEFPSRNAFARVLPAKLSNSDAFLPLSRKGERDYYSAGCLGFGLMKVALRLSQS